MWKFNGGPLSAAGLARALEENAVEQLRAQLRARLSAIRLPSTGEFPTVHFEGETLGELRAWVEGSAEPIEYVQSRFDPKDAARLDFMTRTTCQTRKCF